MDIDPVVDLSFPLSGNTIPADHGYLLYAAISRHLPELHGDDTIGIHPIQGQLVGNRLLALTAASRLTLRLPVNKVPLAVPLAGQRLDMDGAMVRLGVPTTRALQPSRSLTARLVVIRGFTEATSFLDAARRQLVATTVAGSVSLVSRRSAHSIENRTGARDELLRRTLRIRDREVVGFAIRADELEASDSLRLQAVGLGGRRHFGCGIFVPARDLPS